MGCDIHSIAERRNKENGKWEKVGDHFSLDSWERDYYKKDKGDEPFGWRSYSLFGFLADVRNYDHCEPISSPKGLPKDSEYLNEKEEDDSDYWGGEPSRGYGIYSDYHSHSYLTLKELLDFDYDKEFWNRRISRTEGNITNGAAIAEEGEGTIVTYRDNLGKQYFDVLDELKELGEPEDVRIVFWFDS